MKDSSALRFEKWYSVDNQVTSGMRLFLWLLPTLFLAHSAAARNAEVIASFEKPNSTQNWVSVNDGVMGGLSKGYIEHTKQKKLLFAGDLSLKNNGGFSSIRTKPSAMNLAGASGIIVKARGDGRTYWVGLRTNSQFGASSYRAYLSTSKGKFIETLIPLSEFKLQAFGRQLSGRPIDSAKIVSVGFTLADKKAGGFKLEIEYIKAVFKKASPKLTNPVGTIVDVAAPLKPAALIGLAIDRGVPLFNNGDTGACAAVYEVTCEALRIMPDISELSRKNLGQALAKMRTEKTDSQKAWILRHALDQVLLVGTKGE